VSAPPALQPILPFLLFVVILLAALPFGATAGLISGVVTDLMLLWASVRLQSNAAVTLPVLRAAAAGTGAARLFAGPGFGLLTGLYVEWFGKTSRHYARKAWELGQRNQNLAAQIQQYEERLSSLGHTGSAAGFLPVSEPQSGQTAALCQVLFDTLLLQAQRLAGPEDWMFAAPGQPGIDRLLFDLVLRYRPATIAVLRLDGRISLAHEKLLAVLGCPYTDCLPDHPFDRLLAAEDVAAFAAVLQSGQETFSCYLVAPASRSGQTLFSRQVNLTVLRSQKTYLVTLDDLNLKRNQYQGWAGQSMPAALPEFLTAECCCLTADGTIAYISPAMACKLGDTVHSLLGHKLAAFVSKDCMDAYNEAIRECRFAQGAELELTLFPYGQKERLSFLTQAFPCKDPAGLLTRIVLRLTDITPIKRAELQLSHRLNIEQLIAQISSRFIAVKGEGLEREIIQVLRLVCEFENAIDCMIEIIPSSYFSRRSTYRYQNEQRGGSLPPADSSPSSDRFETISVPITIDTETVAYMRIKQDKFRDLWFDSDLKLIRLIGEIIVNAQIRNENLQTIRLNERRLATTLHSIGDGVIATDPAGQVILMNRRAEQMTGWNFQQAKNRPLNQIFAPERAVLTDGDTHRLEIRHLRPMSETDNSLLLVSHLGERFYIAMSTSRIEDENGQFFGEVTVFRDVTQSKKENDAIRYISYHDRLTGLYNRAFFEEEMNRLNTGRQYPITIILGDCNGLKIANDIFGHLEGDRLLQAIADIIRKSIRHEDIAARWGGDEFAIILPQTDEAGAKVICDRILNLCQTSGHRPIPPSLSLGFATSGSSEADLNDLLKLAEDRMYRHKLMEARSNRNNLILSIEKMVYEKSYETEEHASRLSGLAEKIGQAVGLSDYEMEELKLLCVLHDVGKIGIPDKILSKDGPLNSEEWEVMRKHPEKGYNLAKATPELKNIAEAILHHHERWDGSGYPSGLVGEKIPKLARILAIIDTFDVITHSRAYKEAQTIEAALQEIAQCAGSQFDPALSSVFVSLMRSDPQGALSLMRQPEESEHVDRPS
jgi:diguanylate cyclase (GGDEF)-like protein/PAS domain S-box-containing protein